MSAELGGSQLSSLLETVPGLASVLRSPVADAIVNMIRAGAGLGDFRMQDAQELIQYATRRGLIPSAEGSDLLQELEATVGRRRSKKTSKSATPKKRAGKSKAAAPAAKRKAAKKTTHKKSSKKATKKATKGKSAKRKKKVTKKRH
jgi:hypothetical protein